MPESPTPVVLDRACYTELRGLAGRLLRGERRDHTLQPTALVHEAFLRLVRAAPQPLDRRAVRALFAQAMRRVLVDHARRRAVRRRADAAAAGRDRAPTDYGVLHEALLDLAVAQPRQAQLVELRVFGGFSNEEAADVLGVSLRTVVRDWGRGLENLRTQVGGEVACLV